MAGDLIKRLFAQEAVSEQVYTRNFSAGGLPAGVHLVRLSCPNGVHTEKLMVTRP